MGDAHLTCSLSSYPVPLGLFSSHCCCDLNCIFIFEQLTKGFNACLISMFQAEGIPNRGGCCSIIRDDPLSRLDFSFFCVKKPFSRISSLKTSSRRMIYSYLRTVILVGTLVLIISHLCSIQTEFC